jgi:hypothetical protein
VARILAIRARKDKRIYWIKDDMDRTSGQPGYLLSHRRQLKSKQVGEGIASFHFSRSRLPRIASTGNSALVTG